MKDRSDNLSHHEQMLTMSYISLLLREEAGANLTGNFASIFHYIHGCLMSDRLRLITIHGQFYSHVNQCGRTGKVCNVVRSKRCKNLPQIS